MFRLKNKKNRSSNKTTTANTTGTSAFNPASATPSSDDKMSAVRLPFLVVNSEMPSPTNFKGTRIPSTPATVHSMTPIASTGNSPKSAYVDLDSSVDSDEDGACIPSQIDAEVQALLSPLDQGLFNNEEKGNGRNNCFQENSDDDDDDDDVEILMIYFFSFYSMVGFFTTKTMTMVMTVVIVMMVVILTMMMIMMMVMLQMMIENLLMIIYNLYSKYLLRF